MVCFVIYNLLLLKWITWSLSGSVEIKFTWQFFLYCMVVKGDFSFFLLIFLK